MTAICRWCAVCLTGITLLINPLVADAAVNGKKFRKAVASGDIAKVTKLLKKDPTDAVILSGIDTAVYGDHDDIVSLLLGHVEPESKHMLTAIRRDDRDLVRILLDAGSDPAAQQPTPSIRGCEVTGGYEYEKYEDPRGWTPLALATQQQNFEIVSILLEAGADPNVRVVSEPGQARSSLNFSSMAIGAKATVLGPGNYGVSDPIIMSPLILAVIGGDPEIVTLLVQAGATLNQQDGAGKTACDWATAANDDGIISLVCIAET